MKRLAMTVAAVGLTLGLHAPAALAFHCPLLVKECTASAEKLEKRDDADKAAVEAAKKGCAEAMQLHSAGKHKDAMIKAGESIAAAAKALK
jgi:hypothetical protein